MAGKGPSFSAFCAGLNLPLKNVRWSWCAYDDDRHIALFTIWRDQIFDDGLTYEFTSATDGSRNDSGVNELRRALDRAIEGQYQVFGVLCDVKDRAAVPRVRKRFSADNLLRLSLRKDGDRRFAVAIGTVSASVVRSGRSIVEEVLGSAIDDLDEALSDSSPAIQGERLSKFYFRDFQVRQSVLSRAQGRCEYCGSQPFLKADGKPFLECHHIISLAEQGPDAMDNVIALCPNHHREAHFGEERIAREREFLSIIEGKMQH